MGLRARQITLAPVLVVWSMSICIWVCSVAGVFSMVMPSMILLIIMCKISSSRRKVESFLLVSHKRFAGENCAHPWPGFIAYSSIIQFRDRLLSHV